jgi:hypothetical protein
VPKAPELLGKAVGALALAGALPLTAITDLVETVSGGARAAPARLRWAGPGRA